jgi:hypothetical protein
MSETPDVVPDYGFLDREFSESAKDWMRRKAATQRRNDITTETRLGYEPIVFPDEAGCRHAALVVCSRAKNSADAKLLLEALALPTILANGGDGRQLRVQTRPLGGALKKDEPKPIGYDPEDFGRPEERKPRKSRKGEPRA